MGIGDWGLGFGGWGLGPTPKPQTPNPQSPIPNIFSYSYILSYNKLNINYII